MSSTVDPPDGNSTFDPTEDPEVDFMSSHINVMETTDNRDAAANLDNASQESNTSKQMFKNLPDLDRPDWYLHKSFDRYWNHYGYVMNWCGKHRDVYESLKRRPQPSPSSHRAMFSYPYPSAHYPPAQVRLGPPHHRAGRAALGRGQASKRGKHKVRGGPRGRAGRGQQSGSGMDVEGVHGGEEEAEEEPSESTESMHMDMDISEEMLDFFAKSHEHRKLRDAEKEAEMQMQNEDKRINIEEVKGQQRERTTDAPKERPGSRRTSEMKTLYGKGAAMIHGMETAMQMTYDRNFDGKQPKFWPSMPFKCVFKNF